MNDADIAREQWVARCARVLRERGGMTEEVAWLTAESQLENLNNDLTENPEQAAEDEMSYWTAD